MESKITTIAALDLIKMEIEQAGREIYYAMTFLDNNHPARTNLKQALKSLGIQKPGQVGLSDSVLTRRNN